MHLRTRSSVAGMWSRGERIKQPKLHGVRIKQPKQTRSEANQNAETTKAVAWAVFEHHGGGDGGRHGQPQSYSPMGVRRPTRFKIEAQMKQEVVHRSYMPEVVAVRWDAGSTLFDSFELDSLLKTIDQASQPADANAGALVVYSPVREVQSSRIQLDDDDSDDDPIFTAQPIFTRSPKDPSGQNKLWKSFLHSLHLDGAVFYGLQKLQSQVAPHDSKLDPKGRKPKHRKAKDPRRQGLSSEIDVAEFDALFRGTYGRQGKKKLQGSKGQDDSQGGQEHVLHHHHHHHHHQHHQHHHHQDEQLQEQQQRQRRLSLTEAELQKQPQRLRRLSVTEGEDYEMTVQAISQRVARVSFEEKARRASRDFESGLEAPRNSLDYDIGAERAAFIAKPRSVWDSYDI